MRHDLRTGFQCKLSCKPLTTSSGSEERPWDWKKTPQTLTSSEFICVLWFFIKFVTWHRCGSCGFMHVTRARTHAQRAYAADVVTISDMSVISVLCYCSMFYVDAVKINVYGLYYSRFQCILLNTCFPCMIGRDCALGGKVVSGLQQSLHLKPVRNSCLEIFLPSLKKFFVLEEPTCESLSPLRFVYCRCPWEWPPEEDV